MRKIGHGTEMNKETGKKTEAGFGVSNEDLRAD
jgi:hypothetical protein